MLSALGLSSLGLLSVTVLEHDPAGIWLVLIVVAVLYVAYRGYNALRQRYASLRELSRALGLEPEERG